MEKIEIIKAILKKNIYRTTNRHNWFFMCLNTYEAVLVITSTFNLEKSKVFEIISSEIFIKQGKYTSFIWGYTKCARLINKL